MLLYYLGYILLLFSQKFLDIYVKTNVLRRKKYETISQNQRTHYKTQE